MTNPISNMSSSKLFATLRNQSAQPKQTPQAQAAPFYFQLMQRESGVCLRTIDLAGHEIELDYQAFSGAQRELLKAYAEIRYGWEEAHLWAEVDAEAGLLIHEHSQLVWVLSRCDNVVNAAREPITFNEEAHTLQLSMLSNEPGWFESRIELMAPNHSREWIENPVMISEAHLLAGTVVYQTQPLGMRFQSVPLFEERIPQEQINEFLSLFYSTFSNLPLIWANHSVQHSDAADAQPALIFQQVDEHNALHLELAQCLPGFSLEFMRDYDLTHIALYDEVEQAIWVRQIHYGDVHLARTDLLKKLKRLNKLHESEDAYLVDDEPELILGPDLAADFLRRHLSILVRDFELYGAEKLRSYKIRHTQPQLSVSLMHGIDFLEGDAALEIEGESFALFDALQQYKKQKYIALKDGSQAVVDEAYMERLNRLFTKKQEGVELSFFDLPLIEELIDETARQALPKSRNIFRGFNTLTKKRLALPAFNGELRPYQKAGVKWLHYLHEHRLGGCLADDMGLGKTIQAIALLSKIYPDHTEKPTLLVMPRSLLFNWERELKTFAPHLNFHIHYASNRNFKKALGKQLILTTYGTLRADIEEISAESYHAVILDESQAIKNIKTQTARAVLALKAEFRLALSGTPVENNLSELYTLFRFLNPAMFGSASEFDQSYIVPIQRFGDHRAAHELRLKIKPFLLRRLKQDVLSDLPPKVEQVLRVEMSPEQQEFYEQRRRFYQELIQGKIKQDGLAKSHFAVLEALLELRQIATVPEAKSGGAVQSSKLEMLASALEDAVQNNRKCLVFTNFLAGVDEVGALLNRMDIPHVTMTGATNNRAEIVERFQNDDELKVFVMTLKTGGVGLNLTQADTVFILDPWWNTSAESQAVDRSHRIGQKNTVFTYRLIAKNTIEEKILELQQHKKELVDQVISSDDSALKKLTESDIDHLLGA
ncbi:DEAD/DEAH box helicase [Verrucomicrobiota bacterium]